MAALAKDLATTCLRCSRFFLERRKLRIWRGILRVSPAPAVFDQFMGDVGSIGERRISNGAAVFVLAVDVKGDFFAKDHGRRSVLACLP